MSRIFLPPPPANLLAGVMHPLPDLEYRVGLVSLNLRLRARVTGFLPFRCVVLALFIRHLVRMYRPWFVPVLHSLTALFKDHDKHRHKGRHAYDGVNDEPQPYRSFRHPTTLLFPSRGFLSHASTFCNWHRCFCRQVDDLVRCFFNGFDPFLFHRFRILPDTFT